LPLQFKVIRNVGDHSFLSRDLLWVCCYLLRRRFFLGYVLICESGRLECVDLYPNPVYVDLLLVPPLLQSPEETTTGTSKKSYYRVEGYF
jgi:hypothetical protein